MITLRAIAAAICVLSMLPTNSGAGIAPVVAIVKSSSIPPFEEAIAGLTGVLRTHPRQPEVLVFDLEGIPENGSKVYGRVRDASPQLVITVGSLATSAALQNPLGIPIVFSMVLYPRESGFLTDSSQGMTGVALDIPLSRQFETLKRLLPKAREVGVLFNEAETGNLVREATRVAEAQGLKLVAVSVDEPATAVSKFADLAARIDVLWTVADSHVFTQQTTAALLLASLRQGVPVLGLSNGQVHAGAVAALYCDYADIGRQTGEIAVRVLEGESAGKIKVSGPRVVRLALNRRTAERVGAHLSAELQAEADEVVR